MLSDSFRLGMWVSGAALILLVFIARQWGNRSLGDLRSLPSEINGVRAWSIQVFLIVVLHALVIQKEIWYDALERSRALMVLGIG